MSDIDDLISYDPSSIIIQRHTKIPNAGGFDWVVSDVTSYPIDVRLYHITPRNQYETTLPEGEVKRVTLGMLATWGTDVVFGHNSYDTFVSHGRTYRIVGVRHYDDINIPYAIECDCVAV